MPELADQVQTLGTDEILALVDQKIDNLWPFAVEKQEKYRAMTGKYFQGFYSHSQPPADGGQEYPDRWFTHPSDQQYRWADIGALQYEPMPYSIRIDTYNGPEGAGWVACIQIVLKGVTWEKCKNQGPEALRGDFDWWAVPEYGTIGITP